MQTDHLYLNDAYQVACRAIVSHVSKEGLLLDQTVFYPQGGGQAGDSGWLTLKGGSRLRITESRKAGEAFPDKHTVLHIPALGQTPLIQRIKPGDEVCANIDWQRRYRHMRLHTAAHMVCAVLPYSVNGCSITADYARLDFVTSDPLSRERIETALAAMVEAAHPVTVETISDEALQANPELVRTMSVYPPIGCGQVRLVNIKDTDLQPCGGTHVANTREVGAVSVIKIEKKSASTRRVVLALEWPKAE